MVSFMDSVHQLALLVKLADSYAPKTSHLFPEPFTCVTIRRFEFMNYAD